MKLKIWLPSVRLVYIQIQLQCSGSNQLAIQFKLIIIIVYIICELIH